VNYCLSTNEDGPHLCGAIISSSNVEQTTCDYFERCCNEEMDRHYLIYDNVCEYGKNIDSTLPFRMCTSDEALLELKMRGL